MSTMTNNNELNVNRDWGFDVNLSGLVAPTGKGGSVLPSGYYSVTLTDLYINPDKSPNRVIIKCEVAEGPFMGAVRTTGLGMPTSPDDKVRYYWRALAESVGYTPAQLDSGSITLGPKTFQGRTAHIFFVSKEDAENGYENISFLAPIEWAQQKSNFEANGSVVKKEASRPPAGSAMGGAGNRAIPDGPSSLGSEPAPTTGQSKAQILKQLGV